MTIPSTVTNIGEYAFAGCNEALVVNVPRDCDYEVLRELLRHRINVQTDSSSVPFYEVIIGSACSIDVGLKGYAVKGLPTGLKYDSKKGLVTGTVKKGSDDATVIFTKNGETDVEILLEVRKESNPTVACGGLDGTTLTLGVTGGSAGIPLDLGAESGIKSVTATKLPTGMKIASSKDKTSWYITGAPTKAGTYEVAITLTTAAGNKTTENFTVTVDALPLGATGSFNGFVVVDAIVSIASAKDKSSSSDSFGTIASTYAVEAQKNAFGKQWFFDAKGDDANGWTLSFAENAKAAALTVTLNADGKTSVAGRLGSYKITASGYADVSGIGTGAIFADFAPVVTVGKTKKALSLRVNLWFDKKDNHEQGVGSAVFVP